MTPRRIARNFASAASTRCLPSAGQNTAVVWANSAGLSNVLMRGFTTSVVFAFAFELRANITKRFSNSVAPSSAGASSDGRSSLFESASKVSKWQLDFEKEAIAVADNPSDGKGRETHPLTLSTTTHRRRFTNGRKRTDSCRTSPIAERQLRPKICHTRCSMERPLRPKRTAVDVMRA
jgi:hypothetical protein